MFTTNTHFFLWVSAKYEGKGLKKQGETAMHNSRIPERISARRSISQNQKAWKYIQDVNHQSIADLSRIALEDGRKQYTYGLMFREWERYASVFSALGMTGEKHSRTGILGSTCAEAIFSIYGLNMVGADVSIVPAYSALIPRKIMETIRSEHLTDFIITDDFAQINIMHELLLKRDELGLNNIITDLPHLNLPRHDGTGFIHHNTIGIKFSPFCLIWIRIISAENNGIIDIAGPVFVSGE